MGAHVEWTEAEFCPVSYATSREEMPDGQRIDRDRWALVIGSDCDSYLVVQGTSGQLLAFAARVSEAAMTIRRNESDAAYEATKEQ